MPRRRPPSPEPAGVTLAALVRAAEPGLSWEKARRRCEQGWVEVAGRVVRDPAARFPRETTVVFRAQPAAKVVDEAASLLVYRDRDVVVVRKPAGLLTVPFDATDERETLMGRVHAELKRRDGGDRGLVRVVHRLDKDTSGLMLFARTVKAEEVLKEQFRAHEVERLYEAIVRGVVRAVTYESHLVPDRGDRRRGSWERAPANRGGPIPRYARRAVTHVEPREPLRGCTWVTCRLETGRQHQIRIHLAEAGHPLLGESVYGDAPEKTSGLAPRIMLHARTLGFVHPRSGELRRFEEPLPADFEAMLAAARGPSK